jgi:hypothetical protein
LEIRMKEYFALKIAGAGVPPARDADADEGPAWLGHQDRTECQSEKDAKLTQNLGQLQPFLAILPQEEMGQLAHFGPT